MQENPSDLTPVMQERLRKWRENVLPVPSADILKGNSLSKQDQREYGDDIADFENKERLMWQREMDFNQTYRGRR